jgi:hypothetical protein
MREWLDEVGPRILGLICFLTVLNTLMLVGLYFRLDASPSEATEPSQVQNTGEAPASIMPSSPHPRSAGIPLSKSNLPELFNKLMEPFGPDETELNLPSPTQIEAAIQTGDFQSETAQAAFELIEQAYAQTGRPLPPLE